MQYKPTSFNNILYLGKKKLMDKPAKNTFWSTFNFGMKCTMCFVPTYIAYKTFKHGFWMIKLVLRFKFIVNTSFEFKYFYRDGFKDDIIT